MAKATVAINSTIIFNNRSVRASAEIVRQLGDDVIKLPRGFFPKRGEGVNVERKVRDLIVVMPIHFSKNTLEAFA
ncbi:MAG: hypothetical protein ACEQSB_00145 [Undibacterium sp.]